MYPGLRYQQMSHTVKDICIFITSLTNTKTLLCGIRNQGEQCGFSKVLWYCFHKGARELGLVISIADQSKFVLPYSRCFETNLNNRRNLKRTSLNLISAIMKKILIFSQLIHLSSVLSFMVLEAPASISALNLHGHFMGQWTRLNLRVPHCPGSQLTCYRLSSNEKLAKNCGSTNFYDVLEGWV